MPIFKVLHIPSNEFLFVGFVISTIIFVVIGIYEVYGAPRLNNAEKLMWTVGFIVLSTLTGLIYLLGGRSRIQRQYKFLRN